MDINLENGTFHTAQYDEAFVMYVDGNYCAKEWQMSIIKPENVLHSIIFPSAKASGFGQLCFDPYDLSSDDEEYLTPECVAEMTPGQSDRTARLLTATTLCLTSPPESSMCWGPVSLNLNDYHSDPIEISSTCGSTDITAWWREQDETHPQYPNLSNVEHNIFSLIPPGVGVEASFSLGWDVIGWRQPWTTAQMLQKNVLVRQFARANNEILVADWAALATPPTENHLELKKHMEERKFPRMATVHSFLEM